jgi:predicted DNA-binding transcriptional regulator AlpA
MEILMEPNHEPERILWLTRKEAAAHMRLSTATLANWASLDYGPAYVRIGKGRVLYKMSDIEAWLESQADGST